MYIWLTEINTAIMKLFWKSILSPVLICTLILFSVSCQNVQQQKSENGDNLTFTTWENICYDRAASIWLIHNFVDSSAKFRFIEFGKKVNTGTPFDVPGAELGRQRNFSCFETIIQKYKIEDPVILKMSKLVHDIDVNIWGVKIYAVSDSLDKYFKVKRNEIDDEYELLEVLTMDFNDLYGHVQSGRISL